MKPIVPVLGIVSVLWLFLGTLWMSSMVCTPNNTTTFTVNDGKFKATSSDMFTFLLSNEKPQFKEESTGKVFSSIVTHLEKNENKQLILTGLYGENEKNGTAYDNLGIARAEEIKNVLIKKGANGDNIRATSMQSDNLSFEMIDGKGMMTGGVNFLFIENENGETPMINENSQNNKGGAAPEIYYGTGENMFLDITEANSSFTEKESFKNYLSGLKSYVDDNPNTRLVLTCYNDDTPLAKIITRKVKLTLGKMGLSNTTIKRQTAKEEESPNGIAGVNIQIK